ncbi:serine palmitoyltransferase small subunit B [Frankliniella occidentalis]|uniref:Serine palmitoyltransferase small subunit B n=1 Tax=Frankliniella occidentalis TaxID=133901 RepID=A0A6J1TBG5_FRAOC|nr:serine palmitoyltransferase small subunit B [Frankliniella occidentalis]
MFNSVKSLRDFFSYWYFRYLMVTELYIVERWEQRVMNVAFVLLFVLFWYFNSTVLVNLASPLSKYLINSPIQDTSKN